MLNVKICAEDINIYVYGEVIMVKFCADGFTTDYLLNVPIKVAVNSYDYIASVADRENEKYWGKPQFHWHFAHGKSHIKWTDKGVEPSGDEPGN
jgi:hypothetical protein